MNDTHDLSAIYHGHYGNMESPEDKGSGGQGANAGAGGGVLLMHVDLHLHIDGKLGAEGYDATGSGSSGGSGGSIRIHSTNMSGMMQ